jgi:hypothetical protein
VAAAINIRLWTEWLLGHLLIEYDYRTHPRKYNDGFLQKRHDDAWKAFCNGDAIELKDGTRIAQRGVSDEGVAVWVSLIEGCAVHGEPDFGYVEIECRALP